MNGTERIFFAALGAVTVYFLFLKDKKQTLAVPVGPRGESYVAPSTLLRQQPHAIEGGLLA